MKKWLLTIAFALTVISDGMFGQSVTAMTFSFNQDCKPIWKCSGDTVVALRDFTSKTGNSLGAGVFVGPFFNGSNLPFGLGEAQFVRVSVVLAVSSKTGLVTAVPLFAPFTYKGITPNMGYNMVDKKAQFGLTTSFAAIGSGAGSVGNWLLDVTGIKSLITK